MGLHVFCVKGGDGRGLSPSSNIQLSVKKGDAGLSAQQLIFLVTERNQTLNW